jgi:putative hydrolase of the HAD superfamily
MGIKAIFSDIGGVCLSNGWETPSRKKAAAHFGLDVEVMEAKHHRLFPDFESGRMSLREYLAQVVFDGPRRFSEEEFIRFMQGESQPYQSSLDIFQGLKQSGEYLMAALNNEPRELNDFRIRTFGLEKCFTLFFSSCFLGVRKPDPKIYKIALDITRQKPQEVLFIDDRLENIQSAREAGLQTIHLKDPADLHEALKAFRIAYALE